LVKNTFRRKFYKKGIVDFTRLCGSRVIILIKNVYKSKINLGNNWVEKKEVEFLSLYRDGLESQKKDQYLYS
jgi:azurin